MPPLLSVSQQAEPIGRFRERKCVYRRTLVASMLALILFSIACTRSPAASNAHSTAGGKLNDNGNANAAPKPASSQPESIDIKEPDRYTVAMTISAQSMATSAPAPMSTQQFGFARLDADRRWAFSFPSPLGQVVYLEKSGLKYLVLSDRKQYIELSPDALPFQMSRVLTPIAAGEKMKQRMRFEKLGLEPLNGRTAIKYRLTAARDGQNESDGEIFVDQEIGLPLRLELAASDQNGIKTRVIVEARDLLLSPDRAQFEVPIGTKKITQQEGKQQIDAFAAALRSFVDIISGTQPAAAPDANTASTNKNASQHKQTRK